MSPENQDNEMAHKEFFEKAFTTAGEWTRFADPKALGVAVFLSFGAADLLNNAEQLYYGFSRDNSLLQWITTASFLAACLFGVLTVICVSLALFPRLKPKGPESLFYFGSIAKITDPEEYEQKVRAMEPQELESQIAHQAWNVAKTAAMKHKWTKYAYSSLLIFLACWVVGRIAMSFVQ